MVDMTDMVEYQQLAAERSRLGRAIGSAEKKNDTETAEALRAQLQDINKKFNEQREHIKFMRESEQKVAQNKQDKYKEQSKGTKSYGFNKDTGRSPQQDKNHKEANRILNEPGYASTKAHNNKRTSPFGDPALNSWGRDRIKLANNMNSDGAGSAGKGGARSNNQLAGGDIDVKNAKGRTAGIGKESRFYNPDKSNPRGGMSISNYSENMQNFSKEDRHQIVKGMMDGTLSRKDLESKGFKVEDKTFAQSVKDHNKSKEGGADTEVAKAPPPPPPPPPKKTEVA